ncbi:MAG TPA: NADPH:quinone oxidoreductase family protein [Noviherbaspirillum sp.]|nr:NADPH:quinone oxidoreductase family protein [Noviherbaspirillum sp.]
MRAVIINEFGNIDTPVYGEMPTPRPGPGEVVIRVRATAVNFVDLLVIGGKYQFLPERPFTPGKGPAGVVAAVGEGVASLKVGDRVLAMAEHGGYGEQALVAANQCYPLPAGMSFAEAASMSLAYDTAWFALRERGRYKEGETVLVLGASGGVGYAAVQLAKAMGAKVLAGVSSPSKADMVRAAGADALIDLSAGNLRDSLREQVYAATDGKGADVVIDMLGDDIFDAALRAVAWRGRIVVVGFAAGRIPTIKANYLLVKNIEASGLQISDYRKRMPGLVAECFAEIFAFYEAGKVRPAPYTTLPLSEFRDGLRMVQDRTAKGRVVLVQDDE